MWPAEGHREALKEEEERQSRDILFFFFWRKLHHIMEKSNTYTLPLGGHFLQTMGARPDN